jgi:glycosyltransferase involved in cell wall biosynthesis
VDTESFKPADIKEKIVLTTVDTISEDTVKIKRLDVFVKVSTYLPDAQFILIGNFADGSVEHLKKLSGSNVKFTGFLSFEALLQYYQRAKVYCQLSTVESFGLALAEAMSCCCVPVVTRRYAIPEVVGDTGFYVPYNDPEATADAIRKALKSDKGLKARERIQKYFSLETREKRLIEEISNPIGNSS